MAEPQVDPGVQRRERTEPSTAMLSGIGERASGWAANAGRSLLSGLESDISPPASKGKKKDNRQRELERQAHALYPLIRARLRAELVRDLERRGRISRDWW